MKNRNIKAGIGRLCRLFGKTRHAYYDMNWHKDKQKAEAFLVLEMVALIRREMHNIGSIKLHKMLTEPMKSQGIKMGRDALHHLLHGNDLTVKPKKRYIKTTNSNHWMKKYPNLIKGMFVTESEQVWVSDITYIVVLNNFNFLSLITDLYSKQIMGYCLYPTLEGEGCLIALKMALSKRTKNNILIHHSDRGSQYCSYEYVNLLNSNSIRISMTEKGSPYENAIAERVNGILKKEFSLNQEFRSREEALRVVERSIITYNQMRPHLSCDFLTPVEAHQMSGVLKKHWQKRKFNAELKDSGTGFNRNIQDSMNNENNAGTNLPGIMPSYQDIPSGDAPQQSPSPLLLINQK